MKERKEKFRDISNPEIDNEIMNLSYRFKYLRRKFSSMSEQEIINYKLNNRYNSDIGDYITYVAQEDIREKVLDEASLRDRY